MKFELVDKYHQPLQTVDPELLTKGQLIPVRVDSLHYVGNETVITLMYVYGEKLCQNLVLRNFYTAPCGAPLRESGTCPEEHMHIRLGEAVDGRSSNG